MSSAKRTKNHEFIRSWVEERGGVPAIVKGTEGVLRIDFVEGKASGGREESLEEVEWDKWFQIFDRSNIAFLYSPARDSRFFKLVRSESDDEADHVEEDESRARSVYDVTPERDAWAVHARGSGEGEAERFATKREAVDHAKERARDEEPSQVVVRRQDGRFQYESTYGDDPEEREG